MGTHSHKFFHYTPWDALIHTLKLKKKEEEPSIAKSCTNTTSFPFLNGWRKIFVGAWKQMFFASWYNFIVSTDAAADGLHHRYASLARSGDVIHPQLRPLRL